CARWRRTACRSFSRACSSTFCCSSQLGQVGCTRAIELFRTFVVPAMFSAAAQLMCTWCIFVSDSGAQASTSRPSAASATDSGANEIDLLVDRLTSRVTSREEEHDD